MRSTDYVPQPQLVDDSDPYGINLMGGDAKAGRTAARWTNPRLPAPARARSDSRAGFDGLRQRDTKGEFAALADRRSGLQLPSHQVHEIATNG